MSQIIAGFRACINALRNEIIATFYFSFVSRTAEYDQKGKLVIDFAIALLTDSLVYALTYLVVDLPFLRVLLCVEDVTQICKHRGIEDLICD